jgi:hypothetical protein
MLLLGRSSWTRISLSLALIFPELGQENRRVIVANKSRPGRNLVVGHLHLPKDSFTPHSSTSPSWRPRQAPLPPSSCQRPACRSPRPVDHASLPRLSAYHLPIPHRLVAAWRPQPWPRVRASSVVRRWGSSLRASSRRRCWSQASTTMDGAKNGCSYDCPVLQTHFIRWWRSAVGKLCESNPRRRSSVRNVISGSLDRETDLIRALIGGACRVWQWAPSRTAPQ